MNKEDALRRLPSICTTVVAVATDFMQVMHVHKWTFVAGDLERRLSCYCRRGLPLAPGVQPVISKTDINTLCIPLPHETKRGHRFLWFWLNFTLFEESKLDCEL